MFDRNFKRMPEQHVSKLNGLKRKIDSEETSKWYFNQERTQVIIVGVQPDPSPPGTFGIRRYNIAGDRLILDVVVL